MEFVPDSSAINRRRFLAALAAVPLAATACSNGSSDSPAPSGGPIGFDRLLPIPQLAPSQVIDGVRRFTLQAAPGTTEIVAGTRTPTWGYNGSVLGPTLRADRGETVAITVDNQLPESTTTHWHGMHLPARYDGGPHQPIAPGTRWEPSWRIDQPAASLWYHPHPHGATLKHVYRGLAGMFLIDDDTQPDVLPKTYGVDDIPLILQDLKFHSDGTLDESDPEDRGLLGNTTATNGITGAYLQVSTGRVRLRILNASVGRIYTLGFSDNRTFTMIASDGGLLEKPVPLQRIQLSPAERAEIIVEMSPGEPVMLRGYPMDRWPDETWRQRFGLTESFDILALRPAQNLRHSPAVPGTLAALPSATPPAGAPVRKFHLQRGTNAAGKNIFKINDQLMDMARIDFDITDGAHEIWEVTAGDRVWPHNFHIHDTQFRILAIAGAPPPPELAGWKDTVFIYPQTTVRLAARFSGYTDPANPYMYHCHMLFHEDQGMMGQFRTLAPGQQSGPSPAGAGMHS
ncbi:copper oxidase [Mycobacteroides abscessus]|uniref:multicopper oxidase family protein n=1 Tax=Mycobacteroides abscessus TaxID=36809 RepID=UPI0005E24102|nr:multicopper oxidase domain-containing protein [Mycobacteroides abscessus]AKP58425.1 copper oxidase [Mycobacteroides abscessus UC22]AMU55968.1 copper oxidase [Mycobacteroides abscessus]MBE5436241.1 hypothetical protein [Mycobacteroides abscessus]MBE5484127.1 hypothetical protein [Mycobacteroides abscessus]MBN7445079.1 multicopper oxidase domain-containing protein [Mycobacteroides abscessus subsp. abscessus]